ncbi:hypothetical protein FA048_12865 [Pedobacter polaris]|uniref:Uncharacterized protein n=1 Tax=Pedobacter polaris TaxID=2571273 RepID=A0A4U1CLW7_9SPHI|nr:hypothetical protein [Pedobacter polaris]TKC08049.1 hypothetical protein FA048_12865 [Pedobacter polaris]
MSIYYENEFPAEQGIVTVKNRKYIADCIIKFPVDKDTININKCTCVFSILDRGKQLKRHYVGAEFFEKLNNENVVKSFNGYLPEFVFCFFKTDFPLQDFKGEKNL